MFVFPAFITPVTVFGVLLFFISIPAVLIGLVVWHVRKINSIDETLREILEKLKKCEET
jgi:Na+/melibiose symporter-like transporter